MKAMSYGIDNFKTIIDKNYYYVDKSLLIKEIVETAGDTKLIVRPRRFGKTLNQSMLYYFFSNTENAGYLFNDLEINKHNDIMKHQGKYPTIFISFKDLHCNNFEAFKYNFKIIIHKVVFKYNDLILSSTNEYAELKNIISSTASLDDYISAVNLLIKLIYETYNLKTILLIDEYDIPLQSGKQYGYYDDIISVIRTMFSGLLKSNDYVETAIITGCLRLSNENLFSGVNNINVFSVIDKKYLSYYGFTEQEVKTILSYYNISDRLSIIRDYYNGYIFESTYIYNPASLVQCILQILDKSNNPYRNFG